MATPIGPRFAPDYPARNIGPKYAPGIEQWDAVARALLAAPVAGLDTEFYGVELGKQSCAGRALVHVWSVALPTAERSPRGYRRTRSVVLPGLALVEHDGLRTWLSSPDHVKVAHNMNVDCHAIENTAGIVVAGVQDSLALARWRWPERVAPGPGYDLKTLARDLLAHRPLGHFDDLFSRPTYRLHRSVVRTCSCGVVGCRKRKGHDKVETVVEERVELKKREMIDLWTINPGGADGTAQHEKWDTLVRYSGEDAEWAMELWDLCSLLPTGREVPWNI